MRQASPCCVQGKSFSDSTSAPSPASTTSTTSRAVTASASPTSAPMNSGICDAPFDEVEVPAARLGDLGEEALVEVGAHAERRGGDPALPERRRPRDDLVGRGDPRVGEAVGQQQAAAHGVVAQRPADLLAPGEPARVQVRAAAIADAGDPLLGRGPRLGRRQARRDDDVHVVVERDDGEAVLGAQRPDALDRGLARLADLVARHRPGAVDDEGEVDGDPSGAARGLGGRDLDPDEAAAARGRPDQAAVGADGEWHGPSSGVSDGFFATIASTRVSSSRRSSASRSFELAARPVEGLAVSERGRVLPGPVPGPRLVLAVLEAAGERPGRLGVAAGLEVGAAEPRPRDAVVRPREDGRLQHVDGVRRAAPARAGTGRGPTTATAGRGRGAATASNASPAAP